jgi:hypothetical protein
MAVSRTCFKCLTFLCWKIELSENSQNLLVLWIPRTTLLLS